MSTDLEIIQVEGEHCIDSRLVAESLGIEHKAFMETVRKYQQDFAELGQMPFESPFRIIQDILLHKPETEEE